MPIFPRRWKCKRWPLLLHKCVAYITPWSWYSFLPRVRPRGPFGSPPGHQPASLSRVASRARALTHASLGTQFTHIYVRTYTQTQRGNVSRLRSVSVWLAPRWKINIGKPGSSGRASTATSVQAPSRYHYPYSPSRSLVAYPFSSVSR